jgi:hypothetical protein
MAPPRRNAANPEEAKTTEPKQAPPKPNPAARRGSSPRAGVLAKGLSPTPLGIISIFLALAETALTVALLQTTGGIQIALAVFVLVFPLLTAAAFFWILWSRAWVFYAPSEYGGIDPAKFVASLAQAQSGFITKTSDLPAEVKVIGNPDQFVLLFKAQAEKSWKKSTKAMEVESGCVLQVSTEQTAPDGSTSVAEAVTFVPDVQIVDDMKGGKRLVARGATP